jgi:ketosteroid isomerase-like protein
MSNIELIRKFYDAFKNKESEKYPLFCDENIEWITMDGMPNGGIYVGLKAIFDDYFPCMLKNFSEFHVFTEKFLDAVDHVIVIGRYQGISKKGRNFDVPFLHVYQIKDNKITQFRQFTDTKKIQDSLV